MQDTNVVLAISRIMVAWQPVGLAMGVYDMANRYLRQREQFGNPLAAYQVGHLPCASAVILKYHVIAAARFPRLVDAPVRSCTLVCSALQMQLCEKTDEPLTGR